nr:hypothetical protein [Tanacetum cinerariifolium]
MGKLKPINMVIEMADNTKSIFKRIVKNLLIRIDKFIFLIDYVILDIIEDYRMPIILRRHLLATTHAKVDIFEKSISLEEGNEKVILKMRSSLTTTMFESVRANKSKIYMGDYDSKSCEFDQLLDINPYIFTYDIDMQGSYKEGNTDQEMSEEYESVKEINPEQRLNLAKKRVHWCEKISQEKEVLSGINNDLFTYEIEVPKLAPCIEQRNNDPAHNDLGEYEWNMSFEDCKKIYVEVVIFVNNRLMRLIDVIVEQWLDLKYRDLKIMDRTKTYEDYHNELNNEVDEPWSKKGVPYEIYDHVCEPFHFKSGKTRWLTCNSNEDGLCNSEELTGMVRVGYMTYFQDHELYDDLTDSSLKDEALKQKAIYEKS